MSSRVVVVMEGRTDGRSLTRDVVAPESFNANVRQHSVGNLVWQGRTLVLEPIARPESARSRIGCLERASAALE